MEKLNGKKKLIVSVFISGRGTNLKSLINFSKKNKSPIKITIVISNNYKAKGLQFCKKYGINNFSISYKNKFYAENKILKILIKKKIKLVCLAGFMKILSKKFIKKFSGKILNIHPSLLPKYKGLNTHYRVIKNKERFSGCTVHLVNNKLDSGKIILQKKIKVLKKDNVNKLKKKILKAEHKLYPEAISKLLS